MFDDVPFPITVGSIVAVSAEKLGNVNDKKGESPLKKGDLVRIILQSSKGFTIQSITNPITISVEVKPADLYSGSQYPVLNEARSKLQGTPDIR